MLKLKQITTWLVLSFLTFGLVVGCNGSTGFNSEISPIGETSTPEATDCRMVQHDLGETQICGQPQKVVTLSLHVLDLLLSLDVQPVASTMTLNVNTGEIFDKPAQQIPYLGDFITGQPVNLGDDHNPSLETLVALKPDLIIGETGRNADEYELLSEIAPTLLWNDRTALGKWPERLRVLATALGTEAKAESVIQQYEASIISARKDLADVVAAHPKLVLLGGNRLDEGFFMINPDSYLGEIFRSLGFQLSLPPSATPDAPMSIEALPTLNDADTIIVLGFNFDVSDGQLQTIDSSVDKSMGDLLENHQTKTIQQDWQTNGIAQSLTASQENRVYFATFYKWGGLSGPIGTELVLENVRQFFLE